MSSNPSCLGMNKGRDDQDSAHAWICRAIIQDKCLEMKFGAGRGSSLL